MSKKFLISLSLGLLLASHAHASSAEKISEELVKDKSASCPFKNQTILTFDADQDKTGFLNTGTCSRRIYKAQVRQFQNMLEEISASSSPMPVDPSVIRGINPQPIPPEGLSFIYTDLNNLVESIKIVTNNIDAILVAGGYIRPAWQRALNSLSYGILFPTQQLKPFPKIEIAQVKEDASSTTPAAEVKTEISLVKTEEKKQ